MVKLQPQAPALVNFDFVDIANGTGYEDYFLIESEDSGGKDYHLTAQNDFSNSAVLSRSSAGDTDNDFDLTPFIIPRTINGTVLISLAVDGDSAVAPVFTVELYRVTGAGETQIGSSVALTPSLSAPRMLYMRMPITNELIAVGDFLRCRVNMSSASSSTRRLGIDPANRTDSNLTITTTSKISVPYKLDS